MRFFDGDDTMDDGNFIKKLLRALDDETVREKIWEIGKSGTCEKPLPEKRLSKTEGSDEKYLKLLKKLENEGFDSSEYAGPAEWISSLKRKMNQLQKNLDDAEKARDRLFSENKRLKDNNTSMREQIESLQHTREELLSMQEKMKRQHEKNRSLEAEVIEKDQLLQSRFCEGYQCFLAFQKLDGDCRENLSGVIRHGEDFESFICCLAQSRTLEKIWDEMLACVMNGSQDSVDILDDIFNYSMSLINKTLSQPYYERLSVQEGAPYDTDLERLVPDSPNQGQVQDVYLEGFRNRYSHQVIRKSLVSL